ncbi:MAG TPA: hypothetical protein VM370_07760 [Candidatus Thermoplasmatota archaeon]|nr:hypothetical protein [Candidatus Thermoplasmatota archaeon]
MRFVSLAKEATMGSTPMLAAFGSAALRSTFAKEASEQGMHLHRLLFRDPRASPSANGR